MNAKLNTLVSEIYRRSRGIPADRWNKPSDMGKFLKGRLALWACGRHAPGTVLRDLDTGLVIRIGRD